MRVLENPATPSYNMGKNKKHKLRKTKEASDSSDDGTTAIPTCNHINMAVNVAAMKKGLLKQTFGECAGCAKEATKNVDKSQSEVVMETSIGAEASVSLYDVEPTLWVCLQCGNQGCDRNSREKHALKHYEAPRSSCHCLVINTTSWTAWCYRCDDEVPIDRSKRIQECVDIIRKHGGISQTDGGTSSVKRPTSGVQVSSSSDQVAKGRPLTPKSSAAGSCQKIKGLSNLGNTCFFNAVMQNLTQTQCLESILVEKSKKGRVVTMSAKHLSDPDSSGSEDSDEEIMSLKDLPAINITLPEAGPLTQSLINFLQEMNNNTGRSGTVNPTALFGQVCKKAQRFRGFQQQDSHELLRYLMDNMRTEEIKRGQTGILKNFKLSENIHPKKVDEETRTKIREYGRQAKQTFIDALFGGHLISTVTCEECRYISQIFEPFLDLSLPVTEEKPQRPNQATAGKKKSVSDVVEEPPAIGIDGFAYKSDKPSKHVQKKMKQQAKKQAKRKGKFVKNQVVPAEGGGEGDEGGEEDVDAGEDGPDQEENKEVTENKDENDEGNSSNKDDPSDADIEDNLESDTSRCQRFADVPVTQDATQESSVQEATCSVDENIQNSNTEMCNSASVTESICEKESYISTTTSAKTVDSQGSDVTATKTVLVNGTTAVENSATIILAENSPSSTITDNSPSSSSTLQYESNGPKVTDNNAEVTSLDAENGGTCNSCLFSDGNVSAEFTIMCNGMTNSSSMEESTEFKKCLNPGEGTTTTDHFRNGTMCNGDITTEDGIDNCRNSVTIDTNGDAKNGVGTSQEMRNADREAQLVDLEARLKNLDLKEAGTVDNVTPTSKIDNLDKSIEDPQNSDKSRQRIDSTDNENCTSKPNSANSLKRSGQNYSRQSSVKHSKSKKEVKKEACMKAKVTLGQRYQPSSRECSIMSCLHQFTSAELLTGNNKFGCSNCTKIKRKQSPSHEKKETVYSNAAKQYLIYVPPAVLTLHLKRFEQVGFSSRKVNRHVEFPFVLDLAPFCSSLCQGVRPGQKKILYALYGVVEHSGRLNTGHYTAYVKVRPNVGITSNFLNSGIPTVQECVQRHTDLISMDGNVDCEESEEVLVEKLVPPGRWYHVSDSRVNETTESIVQRAQAYLLFYERIH